MQKTWIFGLIKQVDKGWTTTVKSTLQVKFFFSGQLATNSLGLVTKGFFFMPNYINSLYFHQPTNVNKNTVLEIASEYFLLYYRWRCFSPGWNFAPPTGLKYCCDYMLNFSLGTKCKFPWENLLRCENTVNAHARIPFSTWPEKMIAITWICSGWKS